uniref:ARAD1C04840p n=1 Tax=Blastobotrys adeninivorans TaxID=409370 RepID=A0A060SZ01_BLAAD
MYNSQFFFLRNVAISSAAKSCGSKKLCLAASNTLRANSRASLTGSLSRSSLLRRLTSIPKKRTFATIAPLRNAAGENAVKTERVSPEMAEAMQAFSSAKGQGQQGSETNAGKKRGLPMNSSNTVGYWLVGSAGLVFGIVVLGGLTRLTESGLSITEWKPVTGALPPMNQQDWQNEFDLYRNSPEFKILNTNMTLEEFKFIYFMEWAHRLWGRAIGLTFVVPAAYFVLKRRVSAHTAKRLLLISGLIGFQGFIGWWMVKSGLDPALEQNGAHPRVSHYRLATHLGAAFLVYVAMLNTGFQVLRENKWIKNPEAALKEIATLSNPAIRTFKRCCTGLVGLVFITAMSGALVAGLDAGLIYNSFPYMGETIIPPTKELFSTFYSKAEGAKFYLTNMLENPTAVQFNHRVLATTTFCATFLVHMYSLRLRPFLPRPVIKTGARAMGMVTLQAALGISTLVYVVPTPLASAHQAGSLFLLTLACILSQRLKLPRTTIKHLLTVLMKKQAQAGPKV